MTTLEKNVKFFLKQIDEIEKPLLLGFSGGEDSLALAHCLKMLGLPFHLAHFDHAWREKSQEEAKFLQHYALENEIPFHSKRGKKGEKKEVDARLQRYSFFEELFSTGNFKALVLAHHEQDQVETVLKRIFEGTHLITLKGMQSIIHRSEMPIWRPLLNTSKASIKTYLQVHGLTPLDDETNHDTHYLRTRMRKNILPLLSSHFKKEITSSLVRISAYASRLEHYLEEQTDSITPLEGPFGVMWDFSNAHPLEIQHVLHRFFQMAAPSHLIFENILHAIQSGRANVKVVFGSQTLIVDRKCLFWMKGSLPRFLKKVPLKEGTIDSEKWEWKIEFSEKSAPLSSGWREWWKGTITVILPKGEYDLIPPEKTYRKMWNEKKVPAFLRESLPLVAQHNGVVSEFFIGAHESVSKRGKKSFNDEFLVSIKILPK